MLRRTPWLIAFALLLVLPPGALWLGGCGRPAPPTRVILVTVDTLRADHLGTYGYPRDLTPYLDSLAARSVVFGQAISSCPTTAPSHASLFTALQPNQHRLRENGQRLPRGAVTVASLYRERGYETAAISSLGFLTGVTSGFSTVDVRKPYRPSAELVDQALRWIEERPAEQPYFLWLHLFDVHEWAKEKLLDPQAVAALPLRDGLHGEELLAYSYEMLGTDPGWREEEEILQAIDSYDSQVLAVDQELERFFTTLEARGRGEDSVWVITADHGEGLGTHGYTGHGKHVYQEQLRVPLLIHSTRGRYPARRVEELVRLVDLGATLAAIAGASFEPQRIPVEGVSFLPLLESGDRWRSPAAFSQRRPVVEGHRRSQETWLEGEVFALQGPRYKVIVKSHGEDEFYDLQEDPLELRDLFAADSTYEGPEGETVQSKAWACSGRPGAKGRSGLERGSTPSTSKSSGPSATCERTVGRHPRRRSSSDHPPCAAKHRFASRPVLYDNHFIMFKNSFLLCILFSLLALWPIVALLGGCQPPPTPTRVILVTIDTLRADHLGTYGYPRDLTPYLDSLAARSVVFDRAISSCPTTAPSHASLFTSLQPNQHRLRENGQHLSDEAVTVASLYRDRGYATVAISSMGFLAGVTPGFEFVRVRQPYRPSDRLVDEALSWIEKRPPDEPLFLWLHLFDPHEWPKDERLDPQALAALPQRDGLHGSELLDYSYEHLGTSRKWRDEEKRLDAIDRYDSQVLAVDLALERLFTTLEARGLAERSVWVITADHGEGLGNHRYAAHGRYVYQEQLRVPLLIHSTSGDYPARRVAEMVRLVDLGPTLAAMIGASFEAQQIPVEGVSFLPLLEGGERWRPQPAFSQRRPVTEGRRRRSQRHWIEGEVFALQGTRYKVIVKSHGEDELYDLQQDPLERRDLFAAGSAYDDPEGEQVQSKAMGLFRETWNEGRIWSEEGIDPEHVEELRALGYL